MATLASRASWKTSTSRLSLIHSTPGKQGRPPLAEAFKVHRVGTYPRALGHNS